MVLTLFVTLFVLLFIGAPVFIALSLSSLIAIFGFTNYDLMVVAQRMFGGIDKFSLMSVPFFILAANVMKNGGIARRILIFAQTLVGHSPGGLAVTTEVSSMFFGAVSGSSPATVIAIGGLMYPGMIKAKYKPGFTTGLIAASGSVALLIPPSITAIIYCSVTGASVGSLFMAGFGAGLIYGVAYLVYIRFFAKRNNVPRGEKTTRKEKWQATKDAAWALGVPVIIIGGIYSGLFTPTEASGISAIYSIIVSVFIYREMSLKELFNTCVTSAISTSQVMILLAAASIFGWVLTVGRVPQTLANLIVSANLGTVGFLLVVNILMLVAGMFIDGSSAVLIIVPLILSTAVNLGIDTVHLGVIMVATAAIGMFTPPFGLNLFVAQPITGQKMSVIYRGVMPFVLVSIAALIVITYFPQAYMWIPRLMY
jgi:C4-dicarboxylate transporter DctM subunit